MTTIRVNREARRTTHGATTAIVARAPTTSRVNRKPAGRPLKAQGVTTSAKERARLALHLRATTTLSWRAIAQETGYASGAGAYNAAMRYGLMISPPSYEAQAKTRQQLLENLWRLWCAVYPRAFAGDPIARRQCRDIAVRLLRLLGVDLASPLAQVLVDTWELAVDVTPSRERQPERIQ